MKNEIEFFKSLIEVSHIEFQSYDFHRHKIVFSSGMAEKILGYSKEAYYKFSEDFFKEIVIPEDRPQVQEAVDKLIHSAKGEIVEMTARFRRADGEYIWLYTRKIVSERDEKGYPSLITTVAEDITFVIDTQVKLKEKVQQLESISYKNSHQIRSPVASIIGLINLVEEQDIASEHNLQVFELLKQAIEKLDSVIHEINDLSER